MRRKPSFFEKLTGAISPDEYDDLFDDDARDRRPHAIAADEDDEHARETPTYEHSNSPTTLTHTEEERPQEAELAVDVYQTPDEIVVKALVAGVNPNNVDISLTRDTLTLRGSREEHSEVSEDNYYHRELYWGAFSRTVMLPEEVDVDAAEATTTHGILIIRLPKVNKDRETKLKVKSR